MTGDRIFNLFFGIGIVGTLLSKGFDWGIEGAVWSWIIATAVVAVISIKGGGS